MTTDDSGTPGPGADETDESGQIYEPTPALPPGRTLSELARSTARRIARRRHAGKIAAVIAVAALLGAGYTLGGPPADGHNVDQQRRLGYSSSEKSSTGMIAEPAPAATSAPAADFGNGSQSLITDGNGNTVPVQAAAQGNVIIKTGQLSLQVEDIDKAIASSQSTVAAAGGYVAGSNRSGSDQYASASITFRIPSAKWDDALASLRKIGTKVLSEQTDTNDVTMQVVDLNARLDNLKKAESALQSIMARATTVTDVLAVQNQLTQTQGQIEQLTAQRDHLNDQAAMSTLTVSMSLAGPTVTTQATQDWTLANQIDQAAAALVRIGQGIVTLGVWAVIVVVPVGLGLLILLGLLVIARRIGRRGQRTEVAG